METLPVTLCDPNPRPSNYPSCYILSCLSYLHCGWR